MVTTIFTAKRESKCENCQWPILPGDLVTFRLPDYVLIHYMCFPDGAVTEEA